MKRWVWRSLRARRLSCTLVWIVATICIAGCGLGRLVRQHAALPGDKGAGYVSELLDTMGMADNRKSQNPVQSPGGMRQREMMAMAWSWKRDISNAAERVR